MGCAASVLAVQMAGAYSVLAHEAIIDSAWDQNIKPLLLKRFPQAGSDELLQAHAYSYGGCIIQDMGYYPFGNKMFSELAHYVRSGDFIVNLVRDSQDLDEYAFALGALAHYAADNEGHRLAVNPSVPIEYPKLERKYGRWVTYAENPSAHVRVEFGFDALEVARGRYAPQSYHDFIGFQVSKPVLERAFHDTYSLELGDIFDDLDLALGSYRFAVSRLIPEMTKVAWQMKKNDLMAATPGLTRRRFLYNLSHASFEKEWHGRYQKPGPLAQLLAIFIRILPPVGPLKVYRFKIPPPETEKLFEDSFDRSLAFYRALLAEAGSGRLALPNRDFDTGQPTRAAEYILADDAYSKLAVKLAQKNPADVDPKVIASVLGFYRDLDRPYATKRKPGEWQATLTALEKLKDATAPTPAP